MWINNSGMSGLRGSFHKAFQTIKSTIGSRNTQEEENKAEISREPTWILGRIYYPEVSKQEEDRLRQDIFSRFYFSYRFDFCPIPGSNITTDAGWGCMHRSGQMLLAQWLSLMYLGRDWRLDYNTASGSKLHPKKSMPKWNLYSKILDYFLEGNLGNSSKESNNQKDKDDQHSFRLFSIQRLATMGTSFHKEIGHWFGPSTLAFIFQELLNVNSRQFQNIKVVVSNDGTSILLDDIKYNDRPILVLIPARLGIHCIHHNYIPTLKRFLQLPYCLGIAGGKSNSSFYCIGYQGDYLLCLDPHILKVSLDSIVHDFATCHTIDCVKVSISDTDPSLLLAFFLMDQSTAEAFYQEYQDQSTINRIYHIIDQNDNRTENISKLSNDENENIIHSLEDLVADETLQV